MELPVAPPVSPMLARLERTLPEKPGLIYEPKWDGFRCIVFRDGDAVELASRNERPLTRYFPELPAPLRAALPDRAVLDGEIVIAGDAGLDFDALQQRIHPAASRIARLAEETPAAFVAFDLLAEGDDDLRSTPFAERRRRLEALAADLAAPWHLTPQTGDVAVAARWFSDFESAGCDGIVAKGVEDPYAEGERRMVKVKHRRDVDVVVGGYRVHKQGGRIGSLLLGLYDDRGDLHFIGHCSGFGDADRRAILATLEPLVVEESFGGGARQPGGPSRWTGDKDLSWVPVRPELVCQVRYDQLTGDRFRHATRFDRWRPDKELRECTMAQLERPSGPRFSEVVAT